MTAHDERRRDAPPAPHEPEEEVVLLKDLAPRDDVKGGARKMRFGEPPPPGLTSTRKRRS